MTRAKLPPATLLRGSDTEIQPQIEPTSLKTLLHFTVSILMEPSVVIGGQVEDVGGETSEPFGKLNT